MSSSALRVIFAGTPAFAARHLQALLESNHPVIAVYSQPDRPTGRGRQLQASPVKALAEAAGIPVVQPASLRTPEAWQQLAELNADVMVVVAYGLILPAEVLAIPRLGCINVHASLLPRWRGAAPIERALLAGDQQSGVTVMQMDAGLDTGPMLHRVGFDLDPRETRESLTERLADTGTQALIHVLDHLPELQTQATPQDDTLATYARKVEKAEAAVDWNRSATEIDRQIRAGIGRQPAYTQLHGERVRILEAQPEPGNHETPGTLLNLDSQAMRIACGEGILAVTRVQLPGRNPVSIADLLNARSTLFQPGIRFQPGDLH